MSWVRQRGMSCAVICGGKGRRCLFSGRHLLFAWGPTGCCQAAAVFVTLSCSRRVCNKCPSAQDGCEFVLQL